jgi:hypothetical protein
MALDKDAELKKYEYQRAIELMIHHTALLWHQFGAFLVAQTVLIGFLGSATTQEEISDGRKLIVFIGSLFGIILCIPWLATFQHNYAYYRLRWEQIQRAESSLEITLAREGKRLSRGKTVIFYDGNNEADIEVRFPWLANHLPPRAAFPLLIYIFATAFLSLAINSWPFR